METKKSTQSEQQYAIKVICLGDTDVLPGEPISIYHTPGKIWNATFLAIPSSRDEIPHLYNKKDVAVLEAKVLQKQLDFLGEQMQVNMRIPDAAFFVRVVKWDITNFYKDRTELMEMRSVGKKRKRKREKDKYISELYGTPVAKRQFRKANKENAVT